MDLISCFGAGTLLGLRDATAFAPAPAGVEDQDQAEDGQQKGDHPALRGKRVAFESKAKKIIKRGGGKRGVGEGESKARTELEKLAK